MTKIRLAFAAAILTCLGAGAAQAAPTLSIADGSALEGDSTATFVSFAVTLSAPSDIDVTVHAAASYGTTSVDDHKTSAADLKIPAGQTTTTFGVAVFADLAVEPDETFTVTLSDPVGATIARGTATGTIINDDALGVPVARVADVQVTEGNQDMKAAVFTVTVSPAPTAPVSLDYATQDGTATVADGDYVSASGSLAFAAGEATKMVTVYVKGDTRAEPDEMFFLGLKNATGAKVGGGATGRITDDDKAPELSIDDVSVKEGQSGTSAAVFTITLSAPYSTSIMFKFAVGSSSSICDQMHWASADDLVQPANNVAVIDAGMTSTKVTVLVNGDAVAEHDEIFKVRIDSAPVPVKGVGTGTIVNDDGTPPQDPPCQSSPYDGGIAGGTGAAGSSGNSGPGQGGQTFDGGATSDAGAGAAGSAGSGGNAGSGGGNAGSGGGNAGSGGGAGKPGHSPGANGGGCAVAGAPAAIGVPLIGILLAMLTVTARRRRARREAQVYWQRPPE